MFVVWFVFGCVGASGSLLDVALGWQFQSANPDSDFGVRWGGLSSCSLTFRFYDFLDLCMGLLLVVLGLLEAGLGLQSLAHDDFSRQNIWPGSLSSNLDAMKCFLDFMKCFLLDLLDFDL